MKIKAWHGLLAVILIAAFPLFGNLGCIPLQLWDESRLANSALEMCENRNILITTFDGLPDMWSTKPPLLIWLQVFSIKMLGISELSLRLPSAIAALLTCILVYFFMLRQKFALAGIAAVFILVTTTGYTTIHGTRTADYDSVMVLFTTVYVLCFYQFTLTFNNKYLLAALIAISLATLTKGIAGLMLAPPMVAYAVYKGHARKIPSIRAFYLGITIFVVTVGGYYLLREYYSPGYLRAVRDNELGGRFLKANDNNVGGRLYYFRNLASYQYSYWLPIFLAACGYFLASKASAFRSLVRYLLLVILFFFVVINISRTKLEWYIMPLFPLMAIITAAFISDMCLRLKLHFPSRRILPMALILVIVIYPCYSTAYRIMHPSLEIKSNQDANELAASLSAILRSDQDRELKVIWNEYQGPISFYIRALQHRGKVVQKATVTSLTKGDTVIFYEPKIQAEIEVGYTAEVVSKGIHTTTMHILDKKHDDLLR